MTEPKSAFDPENFAAVQLIMMMRLYDLGLALLSVFDEKKADELSEYHAQGFSFAPAPKYVEYEDTDDGEEIPTDQFDSNLAE